MALKRFGYKSTPETRAQARSVVAHAQGRVKEPKGFIKRLVLNPGFIKQVRHKLELTQREFARLLGVEVSAVESWEQGRRTPDGPVTAMITLLSKHGQMRHWLEELRRTPVAA
jgi:DNA-binding transcriptional regulator YiaG